MNQLETIIRDAIYDSLGVIPNPHQTAAHTRKFIAKYKLVEKAGSEPETEFIASLKEGAQVAGGNAKKKGKKHTPKPDPTSTTNPTPDTSAVTLSEFLAQKTKE